LPSFDVVSEVNIHEVTNAVDQANREVANRFDFKGSNARYELDEYVVTLSAENDFQLKQMLDILRTKLSKRGVDIGCLLEGKPEISGNRARQSVTLRHGIEADMARQMVRMIKDTKLKVQASIQDEKVRVTGKKKDELQEVIALLRNSDFGLPLQFVNFRD
jgi:uncharacterized protein YajQ (UPF0234 family)